MFTVGGLECEAPFTFHFGYILINDLVIHEVSPTEFTFHFGYILIMPFYSVSFNPPKFTFHFGYILIMFL